MVDEELQRLPAKYREPLLLHYLEGMTAEAAARQLGLSRGTFYNRLAYGRELLRERLSRQGLSLAAPLLIASLTAEAEAASHSLIEATVRGVMGNVPERVATLAAEALGGMAMMKLKIGLALGLLLGIAAGGVAMLAPQTPIAASPQAERPADPPQAEDKSARRMDRYGDPLPEGAVARLGTLRFRVPGEIVALAFAPDGKSVAIASNRGLFLMDPGSGKRIKQLSLPDGYWGRSSPLVFAPDGKRLARRGRKVDGKRLKGAVYVWNLAGKSKPRDYDAEHAMWIGWSADGEPLAVCLEKDGLCLRELDSGRSRRFECKDLAKPELYERVPCACSPAGESLAVADEQSRVHIWDTATGSQRCVLPFKNAYIPELAFSPDGRILASLLRDEGVQLGGRVQLWDAGTGKALHTVARDQKFLQSVVFTSDGKTLATARGSEVRFWDVATGRERGHTQCQTHLAANIALSPDGKWLVTAAYHDSAFHVWDVASGKRRAEPESHTNRPFGTAFSPDGRRVATGGTSDSTFRIWNLSTGMPLLRIGRGGMARDCAFSTDGRSLFTTWSNDQLCVYDAASGERQHVIKLEDPERPDTYQSVISMYQSSDGKTLVVLSYYYARKNNRTNNATLITGWDASTRKQLFRRRRPSMDSWVALSPDARVLAVPHPGGSRGFDPAPGKGPMRLEDVATGESLLTFPALEGQTWPLAFSPDGRFLASNNYNGKRSGKDGQSKAIMHLWETATAAELLSLPGADNNSRVAFSPDGRLLALTAPAQQILLYDLAHHRERQRFKGFDAGVTWLAFSPDGRRLISGLSDSTLLVWDVGTIPAAPSRSSEPRQLPRHGPTSPARMPRAPSERVGLWRPHQRKRCRC